MPLHGEVSLSQQAGRIINVWGLSFNEISCKIKCSINIPSPLLHLRFQIYSIPDVPLSPNCGHLYFQKQVLESGDHKVSIFRSISFFNFQSAFGSRFSSREITKCQGWISKWSANSLLRWRGLLRTGSIGRKLLRRTRFFSPTEKCGATQIGQLWQLKEQTNSFLRTPARTSWDCLGTFNQDGYWIRDQSTSTSKPGPPLSGGWFLCQNSWLRICSSRWK